MTATTGSALNSRLELRFEADACGVTRLTRRRAGGLCHVGKPYWDGGVLLTQLINPAAGMFAGDRLDADIELGRGASVLLSNPSATRLHQAAAGGRSSLSQRFRLAPESFLETRPNLLIPQAGSEGELRTRIELEGDASVVYFELLAPGRLAHGESLAWRGMATALDMIRDGEPLVRERLRIGGGEGAWRLRAADGADAYVASCWVALPHAEDFPSLLAECESALEGSAVLSGATALEAGFGVIRLMTTESAALHRACAAVRRSLSRVEPRLAARTGNY